MSTTPAALAAMNTRLYLGSTTSPITYGNPIANVGDLSGPSMSANVVDVTSHSNTTPWRTKQVTLLDGGDVSLPLYFIPDPTSGAGHDGTAGLLFIFTSRGNNNGLPRRYKLVFPDTAATTYYFDAHISKFSMKEPVAGVVTADVTFTVTGMPTFV
jgi:hypothetical protein